MRDCWRRAVAELLYITAKGQQLREDGQSGPPEVPDFVEDHGDQWVPATADWLAERGFALIALVPLNTDGRNAHVMRCAQPRKPYIAVGKTRGGMDHAVLIQEGGRIDDQLRNVWGVFWVRPMNRK